jgi:AcrR family transcriptional regulator
MNKTPNGRGRRPGRSDSREVVLAAARRRFLADGYQAVTMRSIAADAGVDAALVSYFFGSKQALFGAAMQLEANPAELIDAALEGDVAGLPERLLRALLGVWDDPVRGAPLRALISGIGQEPAIARMMRELLEREMVAKIAQRIGGADAQLRAGLVATQLGGVVFTRYLLKLEPVASATADELVELLAPALSRVLRAPRPAAANR